MGHIVKRFSALAAALMLALSLLPTEALARETELSISTATQFVALVQRCALDTWSRGKTVRLTADVDLSGVQAAAVPTFGGTFDGGGHRITGVHLTGGGSQQGLFRYVQEGGVVRDLTVCGAVTPEGSKSEVGGIAGSNAGTIQNCAFIGTVSGKTTVGGIAGVNRETGTIAGCEVEGIVSGEKNTGGICGKNAGTLIKCINSSQVNTTSKESVLSMQNLDAGAVLDNLGAGDQAAEEDAALQSHTDTGGVAGYSTGLIQSCINLGTVGYQHMGYNVGGVAGRQSGLLSGCNNHGRVYGRKDVGGVVGQTEPDLIISSGDTVARLREELNTLRRLMDRTLNDLDGTADGLSVRLESLADRTDAARADAESLMNLLGDFVDDNVSSLNDVSAAVADALDQMGPSLDDAQRAADHAAAALRALEDGLETLNPTDQTARAAAELAAGVESAAAALGEVSGDLAALSAAVSIKEGSEEAVSAALTALTGEADGDGSLRHLAQALNRLSTALQDGGAFTPEAAEALRACIAAMADALDNITVILRNLEVDWSEIRTGAGDIAAQLEKLKTAAGKMGDALRDLRPALRQLGDGGERIADASAALAEAADAISDSESKLEKLVRDLADREDVGFAPLGEDYRAASGGLTASLSGLAGEMEALRETAVSDEKQLNEDLRAVSGQFSTVMHLFLDAVGDLRDGADLPDDGSLIADTSDVDIAAVRRGKLSGCANDGAVEADRNVGGIVGTVAIEYDLDPEEDVEMDWTATYESKAVVENAVNHGAVTGKKDCVGGIVGRMDVGTVIGCGNYADVTSTGGDSVGGIAGSSGAVIRESCAKCTLSGGRDVGGIAGSGKTLRDCYALVEITEGEECLGAVAGSIQSGGVVAGNRFVDNGTAGIDGISYAGAAEPVPFEDLRDLRELPSEFRSFTVTFLANGRQVGVRHVAYGDRLYAEELPEIPGMEGHYGAWPGEATERMTGSVVAEAVYTPWLTALASRDTLPGTPKALALAEGRFTEAAVLRVEESGETPPVSPQGGETAVVWRVTLEGAGLAEDSVTPLRLLNPGGGEGGVWRYENGGWDPAEFTVNGQYLCLTMTGTAGVFCVTSTPTLPLWVPLAAAAAVIALFTLRVKLRGKRKKAGKKTGEKTGKKTMK